MKRMFILSAVLLFSVSGWAKQSTQLECVVSYTNGKAGTYEGEFRVYKAPVKRLEAGDMGIAKIIEKIGSAKELKNDPAFKSLQLVVTAIDPEEGSGLPSAVTMNYDINGLRITSDVGYGSGGSEFSVENGEIMISTHCELQ